MSIVDRALARIDVFLNRFQGVGQTPNNRVTYLKPLQPKKALPLFGSDSSAGFALDWAGESARNLKGGPVPGPTLHRLESDLDENVAPVLPPERPYEDPAISPHRARTSEETDQKVIGHGGSSVAAWDGKVRNEPKKDFQAVRSSEVTIKDKVGEEMRKGPRKETYWFLP